MHRGAMYLDIIAQFSDYCCFTYALSSAKSFRRWPIAVLSLTTPCR